MRLLRLLALGAAGLGAADAAEAQGGGFLFDTSGERPLTMPFRLNVGLLGFGTDQLQSRANLDAVEIESALMAALPFRAPHAMQSGDNLGVEFSMEYNVKHLSLEDLAQYEAAVKAAAKPSHGRVRTDGAIPMDVEVTFTPGGPEEVLDRIFHRDFAGDGTYSNDRTPSPDEEPYALFIINPSFKLAGPNAFVYANRYKGSHCTASYVAARRYAVVDIGTSPCPIRAGGGVGGEEGVVAEVTLPMLRQAVGMPEGTQAAAEIVGGVTTLTVSAVRHLFLPDIESVDTPRVDRVLVPLIVLANHAEFDPLEQTGGPSTPFKLDIPAIKAAAASLALPGQEVNVVTAIHNIHDHPAVAMAVMKSLHRRSDGRYIDTDALQAELRHSSDALAGGLVELAAGTGGGGAEARAAYTAGLSLEQELRLQEEFAEDTTAYALINTVPPPAAMRASEDAKLAQAEHEEAGIPSDLRRPDYRGPNMGGGGESGEGILGSVAEDRTRVVPIYVFSLLGLDAGTLLDHRDEGSARCGGCLAVAGRDMIVAMQAELPQEEGTSTQASVLAAEKREQAGLLTVDPRDPTRGIIAALGTAMTGLIPPMERHCVVRGAATTDSLWSVGAHPFGFATRDTSFSQILLDSVHRNTILSSVFRSLNAAKEAVYELEEFAQNYSYDPHGRHVNEKGGLEWINAVLSGKHSEENVVLESMPTETVRSLRQQLDGLEQDFLAISDLLFNLHYGPALEQLGATQLDAETLLAFTKESVEEVTLALGCCAKRQAKPRRDADADDLTVENGGDSGFVFRVLAMAVAFFGTIFCVQLFASAGSTSSAKRDHQW